MDLWSPEITLIITFCISNSSPRKIIADPFIFYNEIIINCKCIIIVRTCKWLNFASSGKMKNRGNFRSFVFNLVVKLKKLVETSDHGARKKFWFFFPFFSRFTADRKKRARDYHETPRKESF